MSNDQLNPEKPSTHDQTFLLHEELPREHHDPAIKTMHMIIRWCMKALSALMVLVIILGVVDVVYAIYTNLTIPLDYMLNVREIFEVFGSFLVVLIAVEIFVNIRMYLGSSIIPVKLVIATALMAIARKVIILDLEKVSADYLLAMAAIILALGISYWLAPMAHKLAKDPHTQKADS